MTTTPTFIPKDFINTISEETTKAGVSMLRAFLEALWHSYGHYLPYVIGIFFILLMVAMVKAMLGRTGQLGSLLYHLFYFGFIGILVWIYGLEIFFNSYFDLLCFIIYVVSYYLVGLFLKKFR